MSAAEPVGQPRGYTRSGSFARVALAYALALGAAIPVSRLAMEHLRGAEASYLALAAGDVVATLVVFAFSFGLRNSSVYDPYWMAVPPLFCAGSWMLRSGGSLGDRQWLVTALVTAWALRLTWNWIRGWEGLDHEDFRYRDLARSTGRAYWLVSLTGLHFFPTALVLAGLLPAIPIFAGAGSGLGLADALAATVTAGGIVLQAVADQQLRAFVRRRSGRDAICATGLWRYSRHPNYLGELLFWTGLALFALATGRAAWWSWLGVAAILALFAFASIPMMERRLRAHKPGWDEHARRTSVLLPLPPRR